MREECWREVRCEKLSRAVLKRRRKYLKKNGRGREGGREGGRVEIKSSTNNSLVALEPSLMFINEARTIYCIKISTVNQMSRDKITTQNTASLVWYAERSKCQRQVEMCSALLAQHTT